MGFPSALVAVAGAASSIVTGLIPEESGSNMVQSIEFGNATTFFRYTASALYGLGISNNVFTSYDIIQNKGHKVLYERKEFTQPDAFYIDFGALDLENMPAKSSNAPPLVQEVVSIYALHILSMFYHSLNLPMNIAFMILTLIGLDEFSSE